MVHLKELLFSKVPSGFQSFIPIAGGGGGGGVIPLDLCMVHDPVLIKHMHNDVVLRL